ncbi:hypothetical protein NGRA_0511 [Nosema granulosis]|uniref:Uncharacterized protein n=1 Tax=Nosema granulosis TaxID=83296 RepID=A0A9P6H1T9_9MICR|nr:hypothetical protein NGRA_0511 [Nosema granulosis]
MKEDEVISAVILENQAKNVQNETGKKFHNMWAFVLYVIFNSSFYGYLMCRRFTHQPLSINSYELIGKIAGSSVLFVLSTFLSLMYIPNVINSVFWIYGGVDIGFFICATTKYEIFCCLLSLCYYLYFLFKFKNIEEETRMVLREACYILWRGFGSCMLIVSGMSSLLVAMAVVFMNIKVYCILDRIVVYSVFSMSLYFYIFFCIYTLKVYTYNYVMLTCSNKKKKINSSALNTFYSLGSITLSVYYHFWRVDCHLLEYLANYLISFISSIQELVISTKTSYSMYLIGIHNSNLSDSLVKSKMFNLSRNSQNIKEQINVFLVLLGFSFMLLVNYLYAQFFGSSFTHPYPYSDILRSIGRDPYTNNIVTFVILSCSVCFLFSMFMVLISSSALSLLILFIEHPDVLRKSNRQVHGMLSVSNS